MSVPEKRYDTRVVVDFPVAMAAMGIRRMRRVQNISIGGLQLRRGLEELRPGEEVALMFRLPDGAKAIRCDGRVAYDNDDYVGICFTKMPLNSQMVLDRFITEQITEGWYL